MSNNRKCLIQIRRMARRAEGGELTGRQIYAAQRRAGYDRSTFAVWNAVRENTLTRTKRPGVFRT
jgi:hypothetical protein